MSKSNPLTRVGMLGLTAVVTMVSFAQIAKASLWDLSCGQLWYERNAIYAAAGYCFKTPQAIAAFGPRCHPPYGQLGPYEQGHVNAIIGVEHAKGCSD